MRLLMALYLAAAIAVGALSVSLAVMGEIPAGGWADTDSFE